jgi:hypothetical protein
MSDFNNSGEFGGNDNLGASPVALETVLEGKCGMSQKHVQPLEEQNGTCHFGVGIELARANHTLSIYRAGDHH